MYAASSLGNARGVCWRLVLRPHCHTVGRYAGGDSYTSEDPCRFPRVVRDLPILLTGIDSPANESPNPTDQRVSEAAMYARLERDAVSKL